MARTVMFFTDSPGFGGAEQVLLTLAPDCVCSDDVHDQVLLVLICRHHSASAHCAAARQTISSIDSAESVPFSSTGRKFQTLFAGKSSTIKDLYASENGRSGLRRMRLPITSG